MKELLYKLQETGNTFLKLLQQKNYSKKYSFRYGKIKLYHIEGSPRKELFIHLLDTNKSTKINYILHFTAPLSVWNSLRSQPCNEYTLLIAKDNRHSHDMLNFIMLEHWDQPLDKWEDEINQAIFYLEKQIISLI